MTIYYQANLMFAHPNLPNNFPHCFLPLPCSSRPPTSHRVTHAHVVPQHVGTYLLSSSKRGYYSNQLLVACLELRLFDLLTISLPLCLCLMSCCPTPHSMKATCVHQWRLCVSALSCLRLHSAHINAKQFSVVWTWSDVCGTASHSCFCMHIMSNCCNMCLADPESTSLQEGHSDDENQSSAIPYRGVYRVMRNFFGT